MSRVLGDSEVICDFLAVEGIETHNPHAPRVSSSAFFSGQELKSVLLTILPVPRVEYLLSG